MGPLGTASLVEAVPFSGQVGPARDPERAAAQGPASLAVGPRELRRDRIARARAEAAVWARVHPRARLVAVDHAPRIGDEVAAVADHDRATLQHLLQLRVDAHR